MYARFVKIEFNKDITMQSLFKIFPEWKTKIPFVKIINVNSNDADTAGIQFLLFMKKKFPDIVITIKSEQVIHKAKRLGVLVEIIDER